MELPIKAIHNIKLSPNENWNGYQYDNRITIFVKLFREHEYLQTFTIMGLRLL